jgi:hypothetical protein
MFSVRSRTLLFLVLAAGLCGCSGGSAAITGKVTADGKEVTAGGLVLSPLDADGKAIPGKPGMADIGPDGSYSLKIEPGASGLAHRFAVRFTPPPVQMTVATSKTVVIPYLGLVPKQAEVEVKPGSNVINIELIPGPQ